MDKQRATFTDALRRIVLASAVSQKYGGPHLMNLVRKVEIDPFVGIRIEMFNPKHEPVTKQLLACAENLVKYWPHGDVEKLYETGRLLDFAATVLTTVYPGTPADLRKNPRGQRISPSMLDSLLGKGTERTDELISDWLNLGILVKATPAKPIADRADRRYDVKPKAIYEAQERYLAAFLPEHLDETTFSRWLSEGFDLPIAPLVSADTPPVACLPDRWRS